MLSGFSDLSGYGTLRAGSLAVVLLMKSSSSTDISRRIDKAGSSWEHAACDKIQKKSWQKGNRLRRQTRATLYIAIYD